MINAIRSIRTQSPALTITPSLHPANYLSRKASRIGFRQASTTTQPTEPDSEPDMGDKQEDKPPKKSGDSMSNSFGEGYATRCDDDGFGVIYGKYESSTEVEKAQLIHENHPNDESHETQGSEVKEKETARHQTNESA